MKGHGPLAVHCGTGRGAPRLAHVPLRQCHVVLRALLHPCKLALDVAVCFLALVLHVFVGIANSGICFAFHSLE